MISSGLAARCIIPHLGEVCKGFLQKRGITSPSALRNATARVAAPSVCFAVACILLAAAPTAPPCFRHWRRSSPLPLVGEPLAKPFTLRGLPKPPLLGATATTAASGGNREELLGPRPAGCERQRSRRWEPQPGQWHAAGVTERFYHGPVLDSCNCRAPAHDRTSPSRLRRATARVAAPSVCFAVARILLAAAPTAPPCFRHWRRS